MALVDRIGARSHVLTLALALAAAAGCSGDDTGATSTATTAASASSTTAATGTGATTHETTVDTATATGTGTTSTTDTTHATTVDTTTDTAGTTAGTTTDTASTTAGPTTSTTDAGTTADTTTGGGADMNWPPPDPNNPMMPCPDGYVAASFVMGGVVCAPKCMGVGKTCPAGETGSAKGVCAFNPDSSGDTCKMGDMCMTMGETCQQTGGGGYACLLPVSHCVLLCNGGESCPDGMFCDGNLVCQYH